MRDLQQIQNAIQHYLLHNDASMHGELLAIKQPIAEQRLAIYRDGYYLRLLEVLQQDYEVLSALLGAEQFDLLGRSFIDAHPSHFRSVRWFGNALANFMREHPQFKEQPALIEMAEFEWLLTESFDALDASALTFEEMAAVPMVQWPLMHFQLLPSLRRLDLHWNTVSVWKAYKEESKRIAFEKAEYPASWIIWRKDLQTLFYSLTNDAAYMIDAIAAGNNFSTICEGLCAWVDEEVVAMHAAMLLKRFILDNLITNIIINCNATN
ncbi:MAG: DNA-binding domain-containing protein [Gammaproteobacteria bacterium]|nr:DNA-binding domain-containing protein [Gammaproteobacteria bacterium]